MSRTMILSAAAERACEYIDDATDLSSDELTRFKRLPGDLRIARLTQYLLRNAYLAAKRDADAADKDVMLD